jgi:hypothetical protein
LIQLLEQYEIKAFADNFWMLRRNCKSSSRRAHRNPHLQTERKKAEVTE